MTPIDLRANCADCAALCCVMLPFDQSDDFAFSKEGGRPCRNLASDNRCTIHETLDAEGFKGCKAFNCYGAGQRVTQQVFAGKSWRDDPDLTRPMEEAFRAMRKLQESVVLLQEAGRWPLSASLEQERQDLIALLDPDRRWTVATLAELEAGPKLNMVRDYVASLGLAPVFRSRHP